MPGYNLFTYRARILSAAHSGGPGAASALDYPDAQIVEDLQTAFETIQAQLPMSFERNATIDIVSGTSIYTLPASIIGQAVTTAFIVDDSGNLSLAPLEILQYVRFQELYDLSSLGSGVPSAAAINFQAPSQIVLNLIPNYSQTGGLVLNAVSAPQRLIRLMQDTTITATVVFDSASVTLASTVALNGAVLQAGDEFGIIATTQLDGSAAPYADTPRRWYTISNVATSTGGGGTFETVITLVEVFAEPSGAGRECRAAQVPDYEKKFPNRLRWIPANLALGYNLESTDQQQSRVLKQQANLDLLQVPTDAGSNLSGAAPLAASTSFTARGF